MTKCFPSARQASQNVLLEFRLHALSAGAKLGRNCIGGTNSSAGKGLTVTASIGGHSSECISVQLCITERILNKLRIMQPATITSPTYSREWINDDKGKTNGVNRWADHLRSTLTIALREPHTAHELTNIPAKKYEADNEENVHLTITLLEIN